MQKIGRVYTSIKRVVKETFGKDMDFNDIFDKVEKGEIGSRKGVQPLDPRQFKHPMADKDQETLYHGTSKDKPFKGFKSSRNGTWFTTDPAEASKYAIENDSMGFDTSGGKIERKNTASRVIPANHEFEKTKVVTELPEELRNAENYKKAQGEYFDKLRTEGYDSFRN